MFSPLSFTIFHGVAFILTPANCKIPFSMFRKTLMLSAQTARNFFAALRWKLKRIGYLCPYNLQQQTIHNTMADQNDQNKLEINVPAEQMEGVYSNLAVITHSSAEFIFDFIRVMPGTTKAPVKSRVVMAPEHAKRLMFALQSNVQKYEQAFGEIRFPGNPSVKVNGEA
jgi:hypothetical protein